MSQVRNKYHKETKRTAEEEQEYVKKGKQTKHLLVEGEKENMRKGKRTKHLLVATYLYKNVILMQKKKNNGKYWPKFLGQFFMAPSALFTCSSKVGGYIFVSYSSGVSSRRMISLIYAPQATPHQNMSQTHFRRRQDIAEER